MMDIKYRICVQSSATQIGVELVKIELIRAWRCVFLASLRMIAFEMCTCSHRRSLCLFTDTRLAGWPRPATIDWQCPPVINEDHPSNELATTKKRRRKRSNGRKWQHTVWSADVPVASESPEILWCYTNK